MGCTPTRPLLNLKSFHIQLWFLFVMMCVLCFYDDVDFYLNVQEWTWNKAWIFCSFSTKIFASLLGNSIDINPKTFYLKMNQCRIVFILQITKIICQTIMISILRSSNESHIKKSLKSSNTASIYEFYFIGRCQNILSNMILWQVWNSLCRIGSDILVKRVKSMLKYLIVNSSWSSSV